MKIKFLIAPLLFLVVVACTKKEEVAQEATTEANEWPEMDSFHMVMAEAFHPFKDSTNLAPAKSLAEEMAGEAEKWVTAPLPEKVNTEEVKGLLEKLKTDTRAFADKVKNGVADEELGNDLTALHDGFHGLMEAWHKGGEHKHDH